MAMSEISRRTTKLFANNSNNNINTVNNDALDDWYLDLVKKKRIISLRNSDKRSALSLQSVNRVLQGMLKFLGIE